MHVISNYQNLKGTYRRMNQNMVKAFEILQFGVCVFFCFKAKNHVHFVSFNRIETCNRQFILI